MVGGHRHMLQYVLQCTRGGQDNFWKRVLSFQTLWVLGMELRSPDLAANTVTC